ncbi:MAG: hypothetical protein N2204_01160 [Anaerolineae bacterium]|nr:hypothetical protein [Anaerolineae bacterium]
MEGLGLFGATRAFSLVATGAEADTHREVVFLSHGDRLIVMIPRSVLSRLSGPSLAAAIGHGLGHFLLAHNADPDVAVLVALAQLENLPDDGRVEELWDDPVCADLLMRAAALSQLQDFSADRISLLLVRDVMAVLDATARSFLDVKVTSLSHLRSDMNCVVPKSLARERASRPHAALPTRAWLLELFSTSALYREAVGLEGGLDEAELARRSATRLPPPADCSDCESVSLDDLLLELILMDSLISIGHRPRPKAEAMITRYLPPGAYAQVVEHYNELSDDGEGDVNLLPWLRMAASRPTWWKVGMVERFLYLVSLDRRVDDQALSEVGTLAAALGATEECRLISTLGFGHDPFSWTTTPVEMFMRDQSKQQMLPQ